MQFMEIRYFWKYIEKLWHLDAKCAFSQPGVPCQHRPWGPEASQSPAYLGQPGSDRVDSSV